MPEISRFYGIVIRMHPGDHSPPHFHVDYAEHDAAIAITDCRILAGSLPPRAMRLVAEWAQTHRTELERDWQLASQKLPLDRIEPLR